MDRFGARNMEFGSDKFLLEFQDYSGSPNQARHYVGGLVVGFLGNPLGGRDFGAAAVNVARETTVVLIPTMINGVLVPVPVVVSPSPSEKADRALNRVAGRHGAMLYTNEIKPKDLAGLIRTQVCAPL